LGGILATFLFGFYIIPVMGLVKPCIVIAVELGIVPAVLLLMKKNIMPLLLIFSIWFTLQSMRMIRNEHSRIRVLEMEEGIMGQLLVVDYPNDYYYNDSSRNGEYSRWLFVNRISQTMDDAHARPEKNEERYFTYVYRVADALDTLAHGKKVLLLGLGGGSVATHLTKKGYQVEVCELDERIVQVAEKYFHLDPAIKITVDDARHFLNVSDNKYDVVIFDTFKGEETPSHVLTRQSLARVKAMLNPGGLVFVNSFGYWKGKRGKGMRSIYKTFVTSGFSTLVFPTTANEDQRNLLFVAAPDRKIKPTPVCIGTNEALADGVELDDTFPVFEKLNAMAAMSWRKAAIYTFVYDSLQRQLPFFH
jgi:spermidine synthase